MHATPNHDDEDHSSPLASRDIVSDEDLEVIRTGLPHALDRILGPLQCDLRAAYRHSGDPRFAVDAARDLLALPVFTERSHRGSHEFARLHRFVAELLLARGAQNANAAISHAELAIEELRYLRPPHRDAVRTFVDSALLVAIGGKVIGRTDDAIRTLRGSRASAITRLDATIVDVVPLKRQEVMMHQTVAAHEALAYEAPIYARHRPMEYYRTVKRVFEFLLNHRGASHAERLLPEFKRAFRQVAATSPAISYISFQKNLGQFYLASGRHREAARVLVTAFAAAQRLGLKGQTAQIVRLLRALQGGDKGALLITLTSEMG